MEIKKPSQILAVIAWASVFIEGWLLILRTIPADGLSWGFFVLFVVIAIFASAIASPKKSG